MKKITLLSIFSLTIFTIKAQIRTYDTIPYTMEYHQKRVANFNNKQS